MGELDQVGDRRRRTYQLGDTLFAFIFISLFWAVILVAVLIYTPLDKIAAVQNKVRNKHQEIISKHGGGGNPPTGTGI